MKISRISIVNLLFTAGMLALSIWAWRQLAAEAQIPTRFDFDGAPIAYMGKAGGLLLLPLITLLILLTDIILPKTEVNKNNINRSQRTYAAISVATVAFLAIVHITIVLSAIEKMINITNIIIIALGIFTIFIGNYLSKICRNYSFGVRTPWTLSSDLAWHKTNRWAGWLTVVHGCVFIMVGLLPSKTLIILTFVSFLVTSVIVLPVYSYFLWRSDLNRLTE